MTIVRKSLLILMAVSMRAGLAASAETTIVVTEPQPLTGWVQFADGIDASQRKSAHTYLTFAGEQAGALFERLAASHPVANGVFPAVNGRLSAETVMTPAVSCQRFQGVPPAPANSICYVTIHNTQGVTETTYLPTTGIGGTGIAGVRTN